MKSLHPLNPPANVFTKLEIFAFSPSFSLSSNPFSQPAILFSPFNPLLSNLLLKIVGRHLERAVRAALRADSEFFYRRLVG